MLDYHKCLEVGEEVPDEHVAQVGHVIRSGVNVCICSWCGKTREEGVRNMCRDVERRMGVRFSKIFTFGREAKTYKVTLAKEWGCVCIIDDNADICMEALAKGIWAYPVKTAREDHHWYTAAGHGEPYDNIVDALTAMMRHYMPNHQANPEELLHPSWRG